MAKLTENSFRDVNIAFANELSLICDKLGVNVWELIELANKHPRVDILRPGPGVGGHCIAVDPWFIVSADSGNSRLIKTAREVNDGKPHWVLSKVEERVEKLENPGPIAIFGLSFKPDIDDMRESPAMSIARAMAQEWRQLKILIVEPNIEEVPRALKEFPNVELATLEQALDEAKLIALLVAHKEFQEIGVSLSVDPRVVDACGINV